MMLWSSIHAMTLTDPQVEMREDDDFQLIDARTFHTGTELMISAIEQIVQGRAVRVKQWTDGRLYLKRTGHSYKPYIVYRVNRQIRAGVIKNYLSHKDQADAPVRLVYGSEN